jgi:hypothetical protein
MKKFLKEFLFGSRNRSALDWSVEEWVKHFRDTYRNVLSKGPDAEVTAEDLYWVDDALDAYGGLSAEAKVLLLDEKAVLDRLMHR